MEPNNIEKDFKEKLEGRTIQPSEMAWDRLDAMLSVAENKKPKKNRAWMYMAASFLVFLLVGVLFLNQEKENSGIETNDSVVTTSQKDEGNTVGAQNNETIIATEISQEAIAAQVQPVGGQLNKKASGKVNGITVSLSESLPKEALAANDKIESPVIIQANDSEKLLAAAMPAEKAKKKSGVKVDPNSLLSAVEEELDDKFKDKVLIGAVKNFNIVRSAVANRNYE